VSRLDLVVGPNEAGKSTFVRLILAGAAPLSLFVNADIIAAQRWPDYPAAHGYEAARIAAATRARLIAERRTLIAETVFSHPSELELIDAAHVAGYFVAVHALLVPVDLTVQRVAARVAAGGHSVPEDKIRSRYTRLWPLVADAIARSDTASIWDNSHFDGPQLAALFADGLPIGEPSWPTWTPRALTARWP